MKMGDTRQLAGDGTATRHCRTKRAEYQVSRTQEWPVVLITPFNGLEPGSIPGHLSRCRAGGEDPGSGKLPGGQVPRGAADTSRGDGPSQEVARGERSGVA